MKHIGEEINNILMSRKIVKKRFAEELGMTDVNLSKIFKKKTIDAALLNRIAKLLNLPISHFFDEKSETAPNIGHQVIGQGNQVGDILLSDHKSKMTLLERKLEKALVENDFLRQEIADKKALIEEKERYISLLLQQKHD